MKWLRQGIIRLLDRPGGRGLLCAFATAYARRSSPGARIFFDETTWVRELNGFYRVDGEKFPYYRGQLQNYEAHLRRIVDTADEAWSVAYKLQPGDVVVEVGAGLGDTTHALARAVGETGKVVAIEAHPRTFEYLQKTVALNGLTNVQCVHMAVLDGPGEVAIQNEDDYSKNRIETDSGFEEEVPAEGQVRVRGDSLDNICAQYGIGSVDFMKLNIEGAERVAIQGMSKILPHIANACVYCHDFIADDTGNEWYRTREIVQAFFASSGFDIRLTESVPRRPWRSRVFATRRGGAPVSPSEPEQRPPAPPGPQLPDVPSLDPSSAPESVVSRPSSRVPEWITAFRQAYMADSLSGTVARGATWSFGFKFGALGLGAVVQIVLARALGDNAFGRYAYVTGWMNIFAVFTRFDFDAAAIRFVSAYVAAGEWGLLHGFQRTAFFFTGSLSVFVGAVSAAAIYYMSPIIGRDLVMPAAVACATLPLMTLIGVHCGALRGRKLIAQSEAQLVVRPLIFACALIVFIFVIEYPLGTVDALGLGWVAAALTLAMTGLLVWRTSVGVRSVPPSYRFRQWFGMAVGLLPSSFAQLTLASTTDVVIVGSVFGPAPAGVYSIVSLLLTPAAMIISSVATISAPMIADLYSVGRHEELRKLMRFVGQINILLAVPAVLIIYLLGPTLLEWFGPTFRQGYPVLVLLGVVPILATLGGNAGFMLSMTGNHRISSLIIGFSAILNIALAFGLLRFGMSGVAAATAIASTVRNVALTVTARRRTGISLLPF